MRKITTLAAVLAVVAPISSSAEARTVAPPGNSEADQYYQTLPGSTGPRAPQTKRTAEDAVRDGQLSPSAAAALRRRGSSGESLATAVARTAPARRGDGQGGAAEPLGAPSSPAEQGLGGLFVPLLVLTGAAAAAFFVVRRRRPAAK